MNGCDDDDDDDDNDCHKEFLFLSLLLLYTISNIAQKTEQNLIQKCNNKIHLWQNLH